MPSRSFIYDLREEILLRLENLNNGTSDIKDVMIKIDELYHYSQELKNSNNVLLLKHRENRKRRREIKNKILEIIILNSSV